MRTGCGTKIEIRYDPESRRATVTDKATGRALPVVHVYWFAWQAFYPETVLWKP